LGPAIESAAVVDPIRNRPKLVRLRLIRLRSDQAAMDHDLTYDALAIDRIDGLTTNLRMPARPAASPQSST
jgi:hypothetical protein